MPKKEKIEPTSVNDIFNKNHSYQIPIYQRNYAWSEKEITQLIEDINDNEKGYYLGNLIVANKIDKDGNSYFEVIDGQQRLTTLYIIYKFLIDKSLKEDIKMSLSFEHRDNSKEALNNLKKSEGWNKNIAAAYSIINGIWEAKRAYNSEIIIEKFINKLENSELLQIEVPKNTELNHYFEIMNTRGEQLEKIDIVKSNLMEKLEPEKREEFASIWDVCSNMSEYVVKSLSLKNKTLYEKYFHFEERFVWNNCSFLTKGEGKYNVEKPLKTILDNIDYDVEKFDGSKNQKKQADGHYESLVQFPEFLLHVLNIIEGQGQLDKENLLERFFPKKTKQKVDSEKFIIELLKYRFYYDMYIGRVKAEQENEENIEEDKDGIFDIREPICGKSSIYTRNTFKNNNIRAIQWALRITYVSQKSMHWVTKTLDFVNKNNEKSDFESVYFVALRELIQKYFKETDLYDSEENKFNEEILNQGIETPHIIFAYLDYLLQEKEPVSSSDYYYRFRTSVEHLYPQKPNFEEITYKITNKDDFGNLFLLTRETNSSLSNAPPKAKFVRMEKRGFTPKLKCAYDTYKQDLNENKEWDDAKIKEHKDFVLKILIDDLKPAN